MIDFGYGVKLGTLDSQYQETIRAWRNDERIWQWCRQNDLLREQSHEAWVERQAADPSIRMYSILMEGKIAGVCGLTSIDHCNRRAEFSLYVDPEAQGKGIGQKALKTLLHHGFYNLGLNCIWGESFDGNPAIPMFEKLGMQKEGTRRDFYYRFGRFVGAHLFSLLRSEFDLLLPAWKEGRADPGAKAVAYGAKDTDSDVRPFAISTST